MDGMHNEETQDTHTGNMMHVLSGWMPLLRASTLSTARHATPDAHDSWC